jgi:preprotein translocase subunit SecG
VKFEDYLNVAEIIISLALIFIVLVQARGEGWNPRSGSSIARTRRGVEKTIFQLTIVLVVIFLFISAVSVVAAR